MKVLYRGFKTECPTGILTEESFHNICTSFFPWGEEPYHSKNEYCNNRGNNSVCRFGLFLLSLPVLPARWCWCWCHHISGQYSNLSNFSSHSSQEFVLTLSLLLRGTEEDRLRWTFRLYDTNGDGYISREEMEDVAQSVRMDLCLFCLMLMI